MLDCLFSPNQKQPWFAPLRQPERANGGHLMNARWPGAVRMAIPQRAMKTLTHSLMATLALVVAAVGCTTSKATKAAWQRGTTTINVTGPAGTAVTGFYIRGGQRHSFTNSVPFALTEAGLSEVEIRKVQLDEPMTVEARYDGPERHGTFANMATAPGTPGVRVVLRNGFSVEQLKK